MHLKPEGFGRGDNRFYAREVVLRLILSTQMICFVRVYVSGGEGGSVRSSQYVAGSAEGQETDRGDRSSAEFGRR